MLFSRHGGLGRPSCVRKRALSGRCKSILGLPTKPEAGGNCVIVRWGGEQPEAKQQSVERRTRFGRAVWRASDGKVKPRPAMSGKPATLKVGAKAIAGSGKVVGDGELRRQDT
jgi:hypothetical protein